MSFALNNLQPKSGSTPNKKRRGRGVGSGKGKTAARGQKGQKSRSGVSLNGYTGGQTPLHKQLPKRGKKSRKKRKYNRINLSDLRDSIISGRIDRFSLIDEKSLFKAGLVSKSSRPVVILGKGDISFPVRVSVDSITNSAKGKIISAGGSVVVSKERSIDDHSISLFNNRNITLYTKINFNEKSLLKYDAEIIIEVPGFPENFGPEHFTLLVFGVGTYFGKDTETRSMKVGFEDSIEERTLEHQGILASIISCPFSGVADGEGAFFNAVVLAKGVPILEHKTIVGLPEEQWKKIVSTQKKSKNIRKKGIRQSELNL